MSLTRRTAVPPDDRPPTLAKRTPVTAYARCLDCGTDEGQPCYDSQDRPLASVCESRTLAGRGSLDRETRKKYKKKKSTKAPNQCGACGIDVAKPRLWCWRKACQDVALAKWRATAAPKAMPVYRLKCNNCRCTYETTSATASRSTDPHCLKADCRDVYRKKINQRSRFKKKVTP